ncbi:hypothetical protein CHS0354_000652 [Potamilus streckersoni]|uniref:BIG2 domain-containing protein n=1 Tax=Potamilus streckersoni TaxID=2493646 RepID=A0AAE0T727_9BIVA|nr:hypothetical protein CHS0354_000652 [Potamilus streckersoni]
MQQKCAAPNPTYTISFESNGGTTVASISVTQGNRATRPQDPKKDGQIFVAWYKESDFRNVFDFNTEVIRTNITLYAKWTASSYTVTFNSNGGSTVANIIAANGNKVTKPADPTLAGHAFGGWYKDNNTFASSFNFDTETITANITLFAKWEANSYTVTFNSNEGSTVANIIVAHGNKVPKPADPTRAGHAFGGWYKDNNTFASSFNFDTETITANITLFAKWEANSYTVTFNSNEGSTVANIIVAHGNKVPKPADPTLAGHAFGGWYKEAGLTNVFNFDAEIITSNITLFAKWEANSYTVTFNSNEGSTVANIIVAHGNKVTKPADPTRAGHAFSGWYKEAGLTNVFNFDMETITANITLFAKWEANSYTVTFNSNEGSTVPAATVTYGNKVTKPADPTRAGHAFGGWYKDNNTFLQSFNFETETITANITLFAKWEANSYTVTFNSNEGSTVANIIVAYGNKVTKPADPTRAGHAFSGWYKEAGLTNVFNFDMETIQQTSRYCKMGGEFIHGNVSTATKVQHHEPADPTRAGHAFSGWYKEAGLTNVFNFDMETITANITLFAKWEANSYTVTFNSNEGSTVANIIVAYGNKVTKPADPTRAGHAFGGWYKEAGLTNVFNFDAEIITSNITLFAKWEANSYTVTFNSNEGSTVANIIVAYGNKVTKPADPTRAGHAFGGWYKEAGLTNVFNFDTETITANITLFAKWEANSYTVTFNSNEGSTVANIIVAYGNKVTKPTDPTRAGHAFGGWYKEAGLTNVFNFDTEAIIANVTLYAKWTINTYTVTFNSNEGSTVPAATVNYSDRVTRPSNPTQSGYSFGGWFKDATLTTEFDFNTPITADITLYAKWNQNQANQFTVSFNTNSGSSIDDQVILSQGKATRPNNPTRAGYTFVDWYKEASFTTVFDFTTEIITADITLYAKWTAVLVTSITFETSPLATLIGKTTKITVTILPFDALNKTLTWTSSNEAVATVDANGLITTLAKGDATITATSTDGSNIVASINIDPHFYVPDDNFRGALKGINPNWFSTIDGMDGLKIEDVSVTGFSEKIDVSNRSISSLEGTLDVSKNVKLATLLCSDNKLTSLDVSKNVAMMSLFCDNNLLTTLDVKLNVVLTLLNCTKNQLETLDVSKNLDLETLWCSSNKLTTLDVSKNVKLTTLACNSNELTTLDVSANILLDYLTCNSNQLTTLDIRGMRSVSVLKITKDGTGAPNNSGLTTFLIHDNLKIKDEVRAVKQQRGDNLKISTWNATSGSSIYSLLCSNWNPAGDGICDVKIASISFDKTSSHATLIGKTTQLIVTVLPADAPNKTLIWTSSNEAVATVDANGLITTLAAGDATITATSTDGSNKSASVTVNVGPYFYVPDDNFRKALKKISEENSYDWFVQVDGVDGLKINDARVTDFDGSINVYNLGISSLKGIEYFVKLEELNCYQNKLTSLDVSKNVGLREFYCNQNLLQNLDVSKNVLLTVLNCSNNQLKILDVSRNQYLGIFLCERNQLTSLNVSSNFRMAELICSDNLLPTLNVRGVENLRKLVCSNNQLQTLDVSQNVYLTKLFCDSNNLESLDLRGVRSTGTLDFKITSGGIGTNNGGLKSIKIHRNLVGPTGVANTELKAVKSVATDVQIDVYTSTGTPDTIYTSSICNYDPNTGEMVTGSTEACK